MFNSVTEIHNKSIALGNAFAASYASDSSSDATLALLENYKDERRKLAKQMGPNGYKRPGAAEAFSATQGDNL